jgi:hypothetical protein
MRGSSIDIETSSMKDQSNLKTDTIANTFKREIDLTLRMMLYPLGFPVEIATNSPKILESAKQSWGQHKSKFSLPPLKFAVAVEDNGVSESPPAPIVRARDGLLFIVADQRNLVICNLLEGNAYGWLDQASLVDEKYLRFYLIEAAVLSLISASRATPVHAACLSLNGRGFLLCGDSGAGKSSIAYAAARTGWKYLSDDATYVARDADRLLALGNSHQMRFRPETRSLFSELSTKEITPRSTGKPSVEVPTSDMPGISIVDEIKLDYVIFLKRGSSLAAQLLPIRPEVIREYVASTFFPVLEVQRLQERNMEHILALQHFDLHYNTFEEALDLLEKLATVRASNSGN